MTHYAKHPKLMRPKGTPRSVHQRLPAPSEINISSQFAVITWYTDFSRILGNVHRIPVYWVFASTQLPRNRAHPISASAADIEMLEECV